MSAVVLHDPVELSDPLAHGEDPSTSPLRAAELLARMSPDPARVTRVMIVGGPHGLVGELVSALAACDRRFEVVREPHSPEAVERIERAEVDVTLVFEDLAGRAVSQRVAERDLPTAMVCVVERGLERGRTEIRRKLRNEWGVGTCLFVDDREPERLETAVVHAIELWRLSNEAVLQRRRRCFDPLTMMTSSAMLIQCADELLARESGRALAIFLVQVEQPTRVEVHLGEETSQNVLATLARNLRRCEPQTVIARQGAGRFVLLLDDVLPAAVERRASTLVTAIRRAIPLGDDEVFLKVTTSMAWHRPEHRGGADVLRDAVTALSVAQTSGNRHAVFDPKVPAEATEAARVAAALRNALAEDALSLVYHPIVDLETGWLRGLEALVRWSDGPRGVQTAASFLPLAQEMDLLVPIGTWALETAVRQMAAWNTEFAFDGSIPLAVNLSTPQVRDRLIAARIHSLLLTTGLPPSSLRIEIPVECLREAPEASRSLVEALAALGVEIWIDDVGADPPEVQDIPLVPITGVKIDKVCVDTIDGSAAGAARARAIVETARARQWKVVAEGVENRLQANYLRLLGCKVGQGFLYDRPLTTAETYRKLAHR